MNDRGHLAAETLDLLLLASLPADEAASARAHLASCAECRSAWESLEATRAHFEHDVLPRTIGAVRERAARGASRPVWSVRWRIALPAAGATALAAAAVIVAMRAPPDGDAGALGVKGGPVLTVVALRGDAVFALRPGDRVAPGDRLRFEVDPAGSRFLLIVGVDGAGRTAAYFPAIGDQSAAVGPGRTDLAGSIEIDAAPGPERLYAYFTRDPLPARDILRALAADPDRPPHAMGGEAPLRIVLDKEMR